MSENVKPESLGERVAREFGAECWLPAEMERTDRALRRLAEIVDRLAAPAAPGIREAAEAIALCVRTTRFGNPRDPRDKEDMIREFERILLSRLGASEKAGWTKEIPRGKYGDRLPFWWRDDTYSKRIVEMVIGVDGVAAHPTWAITPTSEWYPIPAPEE